MYLFNIRNSVFDIGYSIFTALRTAADGGVLAFDPGLNNIRGASDPGGHSDRFGGAVFGAGTALHAPV